ncbi:MAG TPA: hypothetical protein VJ957_04160 [Longimicrobiales bacterium]|nr:hypothetical protein [Longimicrobiales bacterium]
MQKWLSAAIMVVVAAACDATQPDAAPTLTAVTADSIATAALPIHLDVTMHDDHGLSSLVVAWGDGVSDTTTLSGKDQTATLQDTFAAVGSFTATGTLEDEGGRRMPTARRWPRPSRG